MGQGEISIHQDEDEVMNQLVVGAFFLHPDEGLSICKEWIQVCDRCKISDISDKLLLNYSNLLRDPIFFLDTVYIRFPCVLTVWTNCMYVQHDTTRKFFMTVEAPEAIRRGEQVGLRLDLFNNWDQDLEVSIRFYRAAWNADAVMR